jgi:hypothetical protein
VLFDFLTRALLKDFGEHLANAETLQFLGARHLAEPLRQILDDAGCGVVRRGARAALHAKRT